jgi:7-cyano-7-deazaguanine synthase
VTVDAVVLHSGGQDSTTCLAYAIDKWGVDNVAALSFEYGQRHRIELTSAYLTARRLGISDEHRMTLPVPALPILGGASLTEDDVHVDGRGPHRNVYADEHGLPQSFVPGRNVIFFATAAAYAASVGAHTIVTGICAQDHAGYPDCRVDFKVQMEVALQFALDDPRFRVDAPLLYLSKAQTWALADQLGVADVIVEMTHTCYEGVRDELHEWGYGCGNCGACVERARGWAEWASATPV